MTMTNELPARGRATALRSIRGAPSDAATLPAPGPRANGGRLWLHLHLPQLPLEVLTRGSDTARACVLVDGASRRSRILLTNARAAALGIRAGMSLAAAHAMAELTVIERQAHAERQALEQICQWAVQFTPVVSAVPPDGLVLEIRGSLRLFGGVQGLSRRVRQGLRELGYRADYAVAPTPLAAALLARSEPRTVVHELHQLLPGLAHLPLAVLRLDAAAQTALVQLGVRQLGDCRRLPRAGLARRLSPALLELFDRLFGQVADLRPAFELPRQFDADIDLPWEVDNARGLLCAAERLLHELQGYLVANSAMTRRLHWRLIDRQGARENFQLSLTRPGRDCRQLLLLMRETLARKRLGMPVRNIGLHVDDLVFGATLPPQDLFVRRTQEGDEAYAGFIDRLRARCGDEALRGLRLDAGHRPENAFKWQRPALVDERQRIDSAAGQRLRAQRPLWLLERPLRLETQGERPWFDGPLRLCRERERIQGGWWDGVQVERDYFRATTSRGGRLWVYRELRSPGQWYLHGIFD
jgi:protein ImuB